MNGVRRSSTGARRNGPAGSSGAPGDPRPSPTGGDRILGRVLLAGGSLDYTLRRSRRAPPPARRRSAGASSSRSRGGPGPAMPPRRAVLREREGWVRGHRIATRGSEARSPPGERSSTARGCATGTAHRLRGAGVGGRVARPSSGGRLRRGDPAGPGVGSSSCGSRRPSTTLARVIERNPGPCRRCDRLARPPRPELCDPPTLPCATPDALGSPPGPAAGLLVAARPRPPEGAGRSSSTSWRTCGCSATGRRSGPWSRAVQTTWRGGDGCASTPWAHAPSPRPPDARPRSAPGRRAALRHVGHVAGPPHHSVDLRLGSVEAFSSRPGDRLPGDGEATA